MVLPSSVTAVPVLTSGESAQAWALSISHTRAQVRPNLPSTQTRGSALGTLPISVISCQLSHSLGELTCTCLQSSEGKPSKLVARTKLAGVSHMACEDTGFPVITLGIQFRSVPGSAFTFCTV